MNNDIERLNIFNRLINISHFKRIKAVTYIPIDKVFYKTYNTFFSLKEPKSNNANIVISYNFINKYDIFASVLKLSHEELYLTRVYVKQTFNDFIMFLNNSKEIQSKTSYSQFTLDIKDTGSMLYFRIKFIDTKTKEKYVLLTHSKNLIIDNNGIINIIDPI